MGGNQAEEVGVLGIHGEVEAQTRGMWGSDRLQIVFNEES